MNNMGKLQCNVTDRISEQCVGVKPPTHEGKCDSDRQFASKKSAIVATTMDVAFIADNNELALLH